ncbi:eukaryotic elongation factor 2 kinase isoform X3 [Eurytemora carolleeae]|uniref:eukaryotic elongation factor 2 kinase isoform X3 n=1 Tax=Eurytemora carolleeae TaxID=1294199 RepID=UPI000C77B3F7|nr:eukaryotic elongation factor 2 kinase isoform X3 [Eurytemora carolleeae]XP_023331378.1 eukaryotic elongation factor 2 kinase isoform X3 [Eurytemora carolleeae]|eukprot:XP_023331377.1 eukaryotic elongation factor 2 kinase-like isoform X3 [Eurytemora affinis]
MPTFCEQISEEDDEESSSSCGGKGSTDDETCETDHAKDRSSSPLSDPDDRKIKNGPKPSNNPDVNFNSPDVKSKNGSKNAPDVVNDYEKEEEDKIMDLSPPFPMSRSFSRIRTESECSSSSDLDVQPLGLEDIIFNSGYQSCKAGNGKLFISSSGEGEDDFHYSPTERGRFFTTAAKDRLKKKSESRGQRNWRRALRLIKDRGDPWEKFGLDSLRSEKGIRHRYNPVTQEWLKDECVLKIDKIPFAHGAMRECFRMKKLSNFSHSNDWLRDSNNYVAKRYMYDDVRENYFQDVQLQMDAKLWGEEFNRHNPPKKVDIFMMAVIELPDRPGRPLFHVEHYIEGEYVKYNSNSGFVDAVGGNCRQTPQAFSHFTFERSGHQLMVVDVQGVGDLYTDPQIHTAQGDQYGDGNLGTRGMALFFHSHKCNSICESLGLTQFDISSKEIINISAGIPDSVSSETHVRLEDVMICESPSNFEKTDFRKFFRERSGSCGFIDHDRQSLGRSISLLSDFSHNSSRNHSECEGNSVHFNMETEEDEEYEDNAESDISEVKERQVNFHHFPRLPRVQQLGDTETSTDSGVVLPRRRQRMITECLEEWDGAHGDRLRANFDQQSRPSCVSAEMNQEKIEGAESILGQIHLDLAKYHESGRFDEAELDVQSAIFHLKASADCGNMAAVIAVSQLYTGLPNDILSGLDSVDLSEYVEGEIQDIGLDYMTQAARMGDPGSALYLAKAYDSGLNLGSDRQASAAEAVKWFKVALNNGAEQPYLIQARLAELLLKGAEGVERDPGAAAEMYSEAAEAAMEDMKGKLASKFYILAEEAGAEVEEVEEAKEAEE